MIAHACFEHMLKPHITYCPLLPTHVRSALQRVDFMLVEEQEEGGACSEHPHAARLNEARHCSMDLER